MRSGFMIVTLVLVAGCAAASTTHDPGTSRPSATVSAPRKATASAVSPAGPQATCAPGAVGPVDASFISASDGWLLGITLQHCWAAGSSRLVVRKTTDGGRDWGAVPAPPAPWSGGTSVVPDGVGEIYFAGSRDGWAFGPGLWSTHDGGATWRRVDTDGRAVYSLTATNGHVVAAFQACHTDCGRGTPASFSVETSPAGSDDWRSVPGGTGTGQPYLMAADGTAYALDEGGPDGPARILAGPADGTVTWRAHVTPCYNIGANTGTAVTASRVVIACALLGAHPAATRFYRSDDSGAHWRQFSHLGLYDGASSVGVTADGTVLVGANFDGVELSHDGGHSWQPAAAIDNFSRGCCEIDVAMTSDEDGYVIAAWGLLWITSDAGQTWAPVALR